MKFELPQIPDNIYKNIGELVLLFSHVEWLIANAILLGHQKDALEYEKAKDFTVMQKYFETLLSLNYSRKLQALKELGFDTAQLIKIGQYRNTLSHGLVFQDINTNTFVVKKSSKPDDIPKDLNDNKIISEIEALKLEGGKIIEFIQKKGYTIPDLN